MGYSPWGHKESDTTEQLTLALSFLKMLMTAGEMHTLYVEKKWKLGMNWNIKHKLKNEFIKCVYSYYGNGNPLQYSCLENPMDGGARKAAVHGVAKSWTRLKRLSSSSILPTTNFPSWAPALYTNSSQLHHHKAVLIHIISQFSLWGRSRGHWEELGDQGSLETLPRPPG